MLLILFGLIVLIIAGIINGGMDKLIYGGGNDFIYNSDWWLSKNKYDWNKRTWLQKYIFSFSSNGWHFFKFIYIMFMIISIMLITLSGYLYISFWGFIIKLILLYTLHGSGFEFGYEFVFSKSKKITII